MLVGVAKLPKGSRPMGTAMAGKGEKLYVSNGRAGTVAVLDTDTGKVFSILPVGKHSIAFGYDSKHSFDLAWQTQIRTDQPHLSRPGGIQP